MAEYIFMLIVGLIVNVLFIRFIYLTQNENKRKEKKQKLELRIYPDAVSHGYVIGWFLQRKRHIFLFFYKWENLGWFPIWADAEIAKIMFVPADWFGDTKQ